jgi:sulfatase modifying factor 1
MIEIGTQSFFKIEKGSYRVGVEREVIQSLSSRLKGDEIRSEFLYNSYPEHPVEIGTVYISSHLVTLSEFERFVDDTDYRTEAERDGWGWVWDRGWIKRDGVSWREPFKDAADELYYQNRMCTPVLQTSWNDISHYCNWLSRVSSMRMRLPCEYEWEVFAQYHGVGGMGEIDVQREKRRFGNSSEYVDVVSSILDSDFKIVLPGLVWEWCDDWFDVYPGGIENGEFGEVYKVLRGGSLLSHPVQHAREYRFRRCPTARSAYYGFRIAME